MQLISKEAFNFKEQVRNMGKVQNLALCGLFIALYIVLSYFNIKITENIEIRFAFLVLAVAGFYGGPIMGLTVGAASDVLSMILTAGKGSAFFFGFTLSYALLGFFFGMILYKSKLNIPRAIGCACVSFIVGLTLNTLWLHMMYGMPLQPLFLTRLVKELITLPLNSIMLYVVLKAFTQVFAHAGFMQSQRVH